MLKLEEVVKRENETDSEYKKRLYSCKDIYGLTWNQIADLINYELGIEYSESKYRKEAQRMFNKEFEEELDGQISMEELVDESEKDIEDLLWKVKKEKIKVSDERIQANALARVAARDEVFKEIALDAAKEVSNKKFLCFPEEIVTDEVTKKGILCIGDWHYGLDVDLYFNKYSPEIASDRVNKLIEKVFNIIYAHNLEEITVVNLGDMVSGRIHLPLRLNSRIDTVTQTIQVSEILAEMLTILSQKVIINYVSVEDNHSRIEPNKKESINTEAFSRVIDWYLKERMKDNPNIKFLDNVVDSGIAVFDVFNHSVVAVHGDKDPQRGIIDRLNGYLQNHVDLVLSAHMHHFSADENNNTEFFCNGSLIGQDQYAADLRLNSVPSQLMIISTPDNLTECIYKIKL